MPGSPSDQDLIDGCIEGKKESWDIFVERFSKLIYWSIWRALEKTSFSQRTDLVQEIFQDVFHKLLDRNQLKSLRKIESLSTFLTILAYHAAIDKMKGLTRRQELDGIISDPEKIGSGHEIISQEREELVLKALESLSLRERLCVEWHYLDDKPHREIAEILGIPQDTVSTVIRRTREKLKKIFLEKGISD